MHRRTEVELIAKNLKKTIMEGCERSFQSNAESFHLTTWKLIRLLQGEQTLQQFTVLQLWLVI